jgi:hypothetical protein
MKSESELIKWLDSIEADERLYYKTATISSNAPLALIQLNLETQSNTLRKVLNLKQLNFKQLRKEK